MKEYFRYFWYVVKHKWFVFLACSEQGLFWRGIIHDMSKLSPAEFFPYARMFYGNKKPIRDSTGYYKPYDTGNDEFEYAWLNHTRHNKHHWQYWVLPHDRDDVDGSEKVFDMPNVYALEMVCDWIGAGKAQKSKHNALGWYNANKNKIGLSPKTKKYVEAILLRLFASS